MEKKLNLLQSTKKGQAALEFYVYAGAFLFFLGFFTFFFINISFDESTAREYELINEISGSYADMVNFALVAGDGFEGIFYPPKTINNKPYQVSFGNESTGNTTGLVIINIQGPRGNITNSYPLNTKAITGNLAFDSTVLNNLTLVNINGSINITVN